MSVTDLNEYRARRRPDAEAAARAAHPSGGASAFVDQLWPEADLSEYYAAVDKAVSEMVVYGRRESRPPLFIRDETHHFTNNNAAWDKLMADVLARGAAKDESYWVPATPERRAEADRLVRILRSTDQGSNGGDAESHPGDEGAVPRRP